jgi:mycothiol synthase
MRRPLPTGLPFTLVTRAFVPGRDDAAWLRVNQRAFAWNPEQGAWSHETLRSRFSEPWFDASGFLVHERDGRLAGFCWTKIHTPTLGEIYVVAVDPEFHGLGLGRALTLAGLDSLAKRGVTVGMLFVDADNTAAVSLYGALGFTVHRTDCMYQGQLDRHHDQQETGTP